MIRCSACGKPLTTIPQPIYCPQCAGHTTVEDERDGAWVGVARFENAAEAGYCAERLQSSGISTRLEYRDRFDAVKDHWQVVFELQVPPHERAEAIVRLRELLHDEEEPADESASYGQDNQSRSVWAESGRYDPFAEGPHDVPLVMAMAKWLPCLLLAGSVGFAGGWWLAERQGSAVAERALLRRVAESAPWLNVPPPGEPQRRLRLDSAGQWLVEEDRDGDGRFEVIWRFADRQAAALPFRRP
ncbi:MAG: hypothetical protein KatS3mg110_3036 [Pirellulaceae bacterium]|nr:MAG: hypothetical protein KatS3mg110_3036 [Pirellulaceae bacterium]